MVKAQQPGRKRHIPQRTCIACRRTDSKRQLVRVVRTTDLGVIVDPTGKIAGRGAYLCKVRECWDKGLKGSLLNRALKTTVTEVDMAALQSYARSLPDELEAAATDATVQPV
jgi:hypothetical protein